MYLQLAEKGTKPKGRYTTVKSYFRNANRVPTHYRALNDGPPEYYLTENGCYAREDCFDHLPLKEFTTMLSEQGFGLAGIKAAVQKRAARKEEKREDRHDLKVEKKESKIDKRASKSDLRRSKGVAKETRAEKGTGGQIAKEIVTGLPAILDTAGKVVGVVKNGEAVPAQETASGEIVTIPQKTATVPNPTPHMNLFEWLGSLFKPKN